MRYYPAFVDVLNRKAVVVGGGRVAERKTRSLLNAGADVTVVSPELTDGLEALKDRRLLRHKKRKYRKADVKDAFVVVACTSSPETNAGIVRNAPFLVNVAARPEEGNYIVPSHSYRRPLTIAVSTDGASPAVSRAVREEIEKTYGAELARYVRFLEKMRKQAIDGIPNKRERERFLKSLASEDLFRTLREHGFPGARRKVMNAFGRITGK